MEEARRSARLSLAPGPAGARAPEWLGEHDPKVHRTAPRKPRGLKSQFLVKKESEPKADCSVRPCF